MSSAYKMIDVGLKPVTRRRAVACGEIVVSKEVMNAIEEKKVPKGDVLTLAEIAGITAAKRTDDILPLCHPLILDSVRVGCELDRENHKVLVECEVVTHGKTGVEMEALVGVSAALLCIYDLTKSLDKGALICGIRLRSKEGGKSGRWLYDDDLDAASTGELKLEGLIGAVLTVSDSCSAGEKKDESGALLADYVRERGGELIGAFLVPDDALKIREAIGNLLSNNRIDMMLLTGGTGLSPRDVTPEALDPLWTKKLPGFGETFRARGLINTKYAWLSRAEAGLVNNTLVILLPGNPSGVQDGITLLDETLPHMISIIHDGKH